MPNYVPYLLLILLSLSTLLWIYIRTRQYLIFVMFLSYVGMIYVFEYIIVVLLDAYEYFPMILPIRYLDSMLGAAVSNFVAVPTIAALISVFQLRILWIVVFSLLFGGIEWLFLHLGIYEHHWWKVPYTIATLFLFFWFTRFWIRQVWEGKRLYQYITFLMYTFSVVDSIMFGLMLSGIRQFHIGAYGNIYRDDVFFTASYAFTKAFLLATAVFWTTKFRWIIAALGAIFVIHHSLIYVGILKIFISLWLYYLIFIPCCLLITWLLVVTKRHFLHYQKSPGNQ